MKRTSTILAVSLLTAICLLSIASCAFDVGSPSFSLDIAVPGFAGTGLPGAKAMSPNTSFVDVTVESPDGRSYGPFRHPVVPGQANRVSVHAPLLIGARLTVVAYDSTGTAFARGSATLSHAAGGELSITLAVAPERFLDFPELADFSEASPTFNLEPGETAFMKIQAGVGDSGYFFVSGTRFEDVWLGLYDLATGEAIEGTARNPERGWASFRADEGDAFALVIAAKPERAPVSLSIRVRPARFAREGANPDAADGTPALPFADIQSALTPGYAVLCAGSFPTSSGYSIGDETALLGGLSADFARLDRTASPSTLEGSNVASNVIAAAGDAIASFLIEGFRIEAIPSTSDVESYGIAIMHATSDAPAIIRDCSIAVGSTGMSGTSAGIYVNTISSNEITIDNVRVTGPAGSVGDGSKLYGVFATAGTISILSSTIELGARTPGSSFFAIASGIRAGSDFGYFDGALTIVGNLIDAGVMGSSGDRVPGYRMIGVDIYADAGLSASDAIEIARNAIFAGEAWVGPEGADLIGISISNNSGTLATSIHNNVVSGGMVHTGSGVENSYSTAAIKCSSAVAGMISGNTLESGALEGVPPHSTELFASVLDFSSVASGGPGIIGNVLLSKNRGTEPRSIFRFGSAAEAALATALRNGILADGAIAMRDISGNEWASIPDFESIDPSHLKLNGNFAIAPSELASWPQAFSSAATLASGIWKPSASATPSWNTGWSTPPEFPSSLAIDLAGRSRPSSGYWTVGAWQR
jgi:hypothetical protein